MRRVESRKRSQLPRPRRWKRIENRRKAQKSRRATLGRKSRRKAALKVPAGDIIFFSVEGKTKKSPHNFLCGRMYYIVISFIRSSSEHLKLLIFYSRFKAGNFVRPSQCGLTFLTAHAYRHPLIVEWCPAGIDTLILFFILYTSAKKHICPLQSSEYGQLSHSLLPTFDISYISALSLKSC